MSTSTSDDRLQAIEADQVEQVSLEVTESLAELGKVSDTQGGVLGYKYDGGYGWQAL